MPTFISIIRHTITPVALVVALSASAQKNDGAITRADMPSQWLYASQYEQTSPADDRWWTQFSDPLLDSLISEGIDNNYDVLMATRRIEIARQALRQAQSGYYPSLSASGGWNKARTSGLAASRHGTAVNSSYFDLGIDMNWEIDVFGKVTARAKESKAALTASKAEYDAVMVSVAAKIATCYFQLRTYQAQISLTARHAESQKRVLEITQARYEANIASKLDVAQASTTYYSTLSSLSTLRSSANATANSLAVLLGVFPADIMHRLHSTGTLPDYKHIVAVGVPYELLRRRPDVIEAEANVAQYAAALGVAKKDFLPTLSLAGSISTQAHDIGDMFKRQSIGYSIAPTLSWTIFEGFSRKAAVESAKQQIQAGIDNYNLTILTAAGEAETAMSAYSADIEYIGYLGHAVEQAREAFSLSLDLYKQGLTDFINVADSQINLLQYANEYVAAEGRALSDLVALYQALGGGWGNN